MVGTGSFAARPTEPATGITILLATDRTSRNPTALAKHILASGALRNTIIADQMTVAIQGNRRCFLITDITTRTAHDAIIPVAPHPEGGLAFPVRQGHFGDGHRHLDGGIADQIHLDA